MPTGASYTGRNMFLGIAIQSGKGVTGTVFTYYQPLDISGILEEYEFKKSDRRVGSRFSPLGRIGAKKVPFSFSIEANPQDLGRLLKCALGAEAVVVDVASEVGTHTFTFSETLPYFTLVAYSAGIAEASTSDKAHQIVDCKISSLKFSGSTDGGAIKVQVDGEGITRTAISKPTPSYASADPFILHSSQAAGLIKIGASIGAAAEFDEAIEFGYDITNAISADRRINNTGAAIGLREGDSEVKGNMKCIFNDKSFAEILIFQGGTARSIECDIAHTSEFYTGHKYTLSFIMDSCMYSGSSPSFDKDVISVALPFDVAVSANTKITLKNHDVVAYTSAA